MNQIPDIVYVFASLVVVGVLHYFAPSESTSAMLQMIVGGIIGIATRAMTSRVSVGSADNVVSRGS
jgi:hypothetical protein